MSKYFEAEPIEKFIENGLNRKENPFGWQAIEILTEIHYMKTADVEPVRHGHWVKDKYCSVCDFENKLFENFKYCPECGAKMDEKENKNANL